MASNDDKLQQIVRNHCKTPEQVRQWTLTILKSALPQRQNAPTRTSAMLLNPRPVYRHRLLPQWIEPTSKVHP